MRAVLGWLGLLLTWMFILTVTAVLLVAVVVPRVAGATPYTVLTGSMRPGLPPGTLVVAKPTDTESIAPGTVVTYQLESGKGAVVTHRVVAQGLDGRGATTYQTQGDANDVPDPEWVQRVQIRGELWYAVPYLGHLNNLLTGEERQMTVYLVAALLLGYSAYLFTSALVDRRRARSTG